MRIGILSDIHVDINRDAGHPVMDGLVAAVAANRLDKMIIAGDVASDFRLTIESIDAVESQTGAECLFVPGNHDIWSESHPDLTAWDIYDRLMRIPGNLASGPRRLTDSWVAIGDIGWYDYSFGSARFSTEDFDRMQIDGRLWQDKINARWDRSTLEMHRYFYAKLRRQLESHPGRNIILVTHVLPVQDFTVQKHDLRWSYLNAFLGSARYGELALQYDVRYAICGHVHYRKQTRIADTEFICNCLNYSDQWLKDDPEEEIADVLKIIEIG